MKENRLVIYLPAALAAVIWSTAFAGVKIGLQYMSPFLFAGIRFTLAGVLVLLYALIIGRFRFSQLKKQLPPLKTVMVIALLQTFVMYALYYIGLDWVSGSVSAIVMGASPLFAAIVSHYALKNDRMTIRKVVSLFVGLTGIILISVSRDFSVGSGWFQIPGIILLIGAMILSAFSNVYVKKFPVSSPLLLNGLQLFIGGGLLVLLALIHSFFSKSELLRVEISSISLEFYGVLIWLSLVSSIAFSIWYRLLQVERVKVSELNLWKFLIPACGAALAWAIVPGESFDWTSFSGMGIVTLSILIYFI